jgi:predicted type IV restriction endonuclease
MVVRSLAFTVLKDFKEKRHQDDPGGPEMDFIEQLQSLSIKIQKQREHVDTEEAAKNAFVLPFIAALGYDVFDPTEVVPEFTADIGIKKGEKVDYAVVQDGQVAMLFECKKCGSDLSSSNYQQLRFTANAVLSGGTRSPDWRVDRRNHLPLLCRHR